MVDRTTTPGGAGATHIPLIPGARPLGDQRPGLLDVAVDHGIVQVAPALRNEEGKEKVEACDALQRASAAHIKQNTHSIRDTSLEAESCAKAKTLARTFPKCWAYHSCCRRDDAL